MKNGTVFALDPDNKGAKVWQVNVSPNPLSGILWGGAADGTTVYYGMSGGGVAAVQLATGEKTWFNALEPPAGHGRAANSAAVTAIPGVAFSGARTGMLYALASGDGHKLWEFDTARAFDTANKVAARGGTMASASTPDRCARAGRLSSGASIHSRPFMHGTLDTFSVVEVLQMLGRVRRSGTLHIECAERQIDVHFVQGQIAETRDSTRVYADTVLGSLLIKRSLVTEEQLDQALREQETDPRPIGTILAQRGFVSEDDLREVLSRQVANTFLAVKTTDNTGTFMFVIDDTAEPVDYITIDTQSVLIEVSSVGADYVAAFELLGAANTVLVRNRDYETLPRHPIAMGRDEFHVLALIDDAAHGQRGGRAPAISKRSPSSPSWASSARPRCCSRRPTERPRRSPTRSCAPTATACGTRSRRSPRRRGRAVETAAPAPPGARRLPTPRPLSPPAAPAPTAPPAPELGPDGSGLDWAFDHEPDTPARPPPAAGRAAGGAGAASPAAGAEPRRRRAGRGDRVAGRRLVLVGAGPRTSRRRPAGT